MIEKWRTASWWRLMQTVYITDAQEWHIVSLLGDVTSPTTVAHYVSMTSHLRVLSTEKHWQPGRRHAVYTNKRRAKYIVRHWTSREASLRPAVEGGLKRFPLNSVICAPMVYMVLQRKGIRERSGIDDVHLLGGHIRNLKEEQFYKERIRREFRNWF